jgi:hypothetical protein
VLEAPRRRTLLWTFVAMTLVFGGAMGTFSATALASPRTPPGVAVTSGIVGGLLSGLFFGVTMTLFIAWTWSQHGGADQAARIARALKAGRLPTDADTSTWDPILARQQTSARRGVWLVTLEFAVFALASVLVLVLPDSPSDSLLPAWLPWVGIVFFGAMTVVSPVANLRRARRIRSLREQLREQLRETDIAPESP